MTQTQTSIVELFLVSWNITTLSPGTVVSVDSVTEWQGGEGMTSARIPSQIAPRRPNYLLANFLIRVTSKDLKPRPK
jgi:hypothetical protein